MVFAKTDAENRKENFLLGKAVLLFGKTKVDFAKRDVENRKQDFLLGKAALLFGKTKVVFAKRDVENRKQDFLLGKAVFLFGKTKMDFAKRDVENRKQDFFREKESCLQGQYHRPWLRLFRERWVCHPERGEGTGEKALEREMHKNVFKMSFKKISNIKPQHIEAN